MSKPLAFFLRSQVSRYVLFLVGRVGSTYLTSLLNSHPDIYGLQEELAQIKGAGSAQAQLDWTRNFLTPPLVGRKKAIGFTVKLVQVAEPERFAQLLREMNCRTIHLYRRNRIKAVVSHINGKRLKESTGMWGLFKEDDRPQAFAISPEEFDQVLRHREKVDGELEDYVNRLQLPLLSLCYEDLLVDRDAFLQRVFAFLEVEPQPVQAATLKITSDNLREAVTNFDQLRARYQGTLYESMFDEVLA